ncbi:MAG: ElyC/SanA/YdcF family protein [Pseudomonadota bacterium]
MIFSLESKYPPVLVHKQELEKYKNIKWVVVLSGGGDFNRGLSANNQLFISTLARLIEGIRIVKKIPDAKILLSGGAGGSKYPSAMIMANTSLDMGIARERIVIEKKSNDTKDEAKLIKNIVGQEKIILVTSANHLPRSSALFKKVGVNHIPAPCDYFNNLGSQGFFYNMIPKARNMYKTKIAIYEYLGIAWAYLRGLI